MGRSVSPGFPQVSGSLLGSNYVALFYYPEQEERGCRLILPPGTRGNGDVALFSHPEHATRNKRKWGCRLILAPATRGNGDVAVFIHPEQEKMGTSLYHPTRNMPPGTRGNGDVALLLHIVIIPPGTIGNVDIALFFHPEQEQMGTSPYSSTRNKKKWGLHLSIPPGTRERG